tara:strand:- start:246 stop:482 length:237 start_codon:yes stop_codon:yes gene_type:complete
MIEKYYVFTDPHPIGGQSYTLITEEEILDEYRLENSAFSRTEQLHNFVVENQATQLTPQEFILLKRINEHFLNPKIVK